jgi:hypothetical protein
LHCGIRRAGMILAVPDVTANVLVLAPGRGLVLVKAHDRPAICQ